MTEFDAALKMATAHVYLIEWVPEDWPTDMMKRNEWCKTYIVAKSVDEATNRLSSNPADIKRITILGDVIERETLQWGNLESAPPLTLPDGWAQFGSATLHTDKIA